MTLATILDRAGDSLGGYLPRLGVFAVTALAPLGIPTQVLLLAAILLGAVALTLAPAFGIGGRDTVNGSRGRISPIEATGTVLQTDGGDHVRIPNSQLVASVATLHGRDSR